jgi:membrane protein DedA with SNARE-associated domain
MFEWINRIMAELGAFGVGLLMLIENIFPPIPSEVIMPLAGLAAAVEGSGFWVAVIAGSIGSLLGTGMWYWIGRRVPEHRLRSFLDRRGRWLTLDNDDLDRAKDWFDRHGRIAVFVCRLIPGIRTLISVPAGLSSMPAFSFVYCSAAGTFLWTFLLAYVGFWLGEDHERVSAYLSPVSKIVFGVILVMYLWRVVRRKDMRTRNQA